MQIGPQYFPVGDVAATSPGKRNRGDLMVVVKLMLVGVLSRPTSRPSSGDLCILQGFGVVPTSTILLAGVER